MRRTRGHLALIGAAGLLLGLSFTSDAHAAPPEGEAGSKEAPAASEPAPSTQAEIEEAPADPNPPAPPPAGRRQPAPPELNQVDLWDGLVGQQITLTLSGDNTLKGKLMGQQGGQLVVARLGDGAVLGVPHADVKSVHVNMKANRTTRSDRVRPVDDGSGMIAGGAVLLGLGIPAAAAGGTLMWIFPGANLFMNMHLLVGGAGFIAGGSAMLAVGVERRRFSRMDALRARAQVGGFGGQHPQIPYSYTLRF